MIISMLVPQHPAKASYVILASFLLFFGKVRYNRSHCTSLAGKITAQRVFFGSFLIKVTNPPLSSKMMNVWKVLLGTR
ncbi:MAG: hypothetical protein WHS64_07265 [Fervidobacterium sp.]|uniref:hypothetical protein n=1 Tax=Fervidobacterium sp. TaxID=1871331 RepID=UPI0030A5A053